ncbi:MAG: glycoside hydrolase family 3 protein [Deltaproteobacteria bacterium]|nr:glycoside hydrolase family 3 protein [Deltaproteobacteria bacterium]
MPVPKYISHHKTSPSIRICILIFLTILLLVPSSIFSGTHESLDTQIGQMLILGFRGLSVTNESPIMTDIKARHIGGVILFDYDIPSKSPVRNISSPEQVKSLVAKLQDAASIPLLVAIDQEGGQVNRLKEKFGFPPTVSEQYLGTLDDRLITKAYAQAMAETLAGLGINTNFAPVVDLNANVKNPIIGELGRSYSEKPAVVIRNSLIVLDAMREKGILSAIKHFPGHGSSTGDSHKGFVDVTTTWSSIELIPFKTIIGTGVCDMVMTAHIFNEKLDPKWPATLSDKIISGILRNKFNYDGVVVSDDMQMKAIRTYYGLEKAIERAILAGCDVLIFANNSIFEEDIGEQAAEIIKKLVRKGAISTDRIVDSNRRIKRLKEKIFLPASNK